MKIMCMYKKMTKATKFPKLILGLFALLLVIGSGWFGGIYWLSLEIKKKEPEIQAYIQQKLNLPLQYEGIETKAELSGVSIAVKNIVMEEHKLFIEKLELYPNLTHSLIKREISFKDIIVHGLKTHYPLDETKDKTKADKASDINDASKKNQDEKISENALLPLLAKLKNQQKITLKKAEIVWTGKFGQIVQKLNGKFEWISASSHAFKFQGNQFLKFNEGNFFSESPLAFTFDPNEEKIYLKTGLQNAVLECHFTRAEGLDCIIKADQLNLARLHKNLIFKELKHGWITWLIQALAQGTTEGHVRIFGPLDQLDWKGQFHFHKVTMKYANGWPEIAQAKGTVSIEKPAVIVQVDSGSVHGTAVQKAEVTVAPINMGKPTFVSLAGDFTGQLEQGMEFLKQSPLQNIYQKLQAIHPKGPMDLNLNLKIPVGKMTEKLSTEMVGKLTTEEGSLWIKELDLPIEAVQGTFEFTEKGLTTKEPVQALFLDNPISIEAKGKEGIFARTFLTMDFLQQRFSASLLKQLQGGTEVEIEIPNENNRWIFRTMQKGVAIHLPKPLGKSKEETRPLKVTVKKIKNTLAYAFETEFANNKLYYDSQTPNTWTVDGPMVTGNITLPSENDATVKINLERLNLTGDEDSTFKTQIQSKFLSDDFHKNTILFNCKNTTIGGKNLGQVNFTLEPSSSGFSIKTLTAATKSFQLDATGEWQIKRGAENANNTVLRGQFSSHDIGAALAQLGFTSSFNSGNGKIKFGLQWASHPLDFSLAKLQGNALVVMRSGTILGVNTGFGRVLGLFNLDSVKRRLQLDFNDVTKKGFAFDSLEGNIVFRQGTALAERFIIEGPAAKIKLAGNIDLQSKGLNLGMSVSPKIMNSSLPIAAGLATGNPAVGMGVWVFDKITNSSLSNITGSITQFRYQITGTWETPSIVETGSGAFQKDSSRR